MYGNKASITEPRHICKEQVRRYQRLWLKVLLVALADHQRNLKKVGKDYSFERAMVSDPGRWFYSMSEEPASFRWVCTMLDVDPDTLLTKLNTRDLFATLKKWLSEVPAEDGSTE